MVFFVQICIFCLKNLLLYLAIFKIMIGLFFYNDILNFELAMCTRSKTLAYLVSTI